MTEKEIDMRPIEFFIYSYLRDNATDNVIFTSQSKLSKKLKLCIKTIYRNLKELKEYNVIKTEYVQANGIKGTYIHLLDQDKWRAMSM